MQVFQGYGEVFQPQRIRLENFLEEFWLLASRLVFLFVSSLYGGSFGNHSMMVLLKNDLPSSHNVDTSSVITHLH